MLNSIWNILGLIATIIFGILSIFMTIFLVRRRYPGQITFVREETIALFDKIVKNLPELSVLYQNRPVNPNLVLIKGSLINTGTRDISLDMIENPITIILPSSFKWLTAKVVETSQNVNANIKVIEDNILLLTNELFRCNEYIRFQALAEVPSKYNHKKKSDDLTTESQLNNALKFQHRIVDTRAVNMKILKDDKELKKTIGSFASLLPIAFITMLFFYFFSPKVTQVFVYEFSIDTLQTMQVRVKDIKKDKINIEGITNSFKMSLTRDQFFSKCKGHPIVKSYRETFRTNIAFFIVTMLIFSLPLIILVFRYRSDKRLRQLLFLDAKETSSSSADVKQ